MERKHFGQTLPRQRASGAQPEMLTMLGKRARNAGIENVTRILSTVADPKLPAASCDLVLLVDQ